MADDANYIGEMDISVPLASASAGEGDDEIRAVKRAVTQSFPGDPTGAYNSSVADSYDIGVVVGPRYLNSLPTKFATVNSTLTAYDTRLDALEAPSTAGQIGVGMIVMWAGGATYPTGWRICDGTAGTVDLRNKFVVCAGSSYAAGSSGGAASKTTDAGGSHTHTNVTTGAHALTVAQMPLHGHPYQHKVGIENSVQSGNTGGIVTGTATSRVVEAAFTGTPSDTQGQQIGGAGGGEAHTHTGGTVAADGSAHTHTVNVVPPYYALVFIQYTGA